MSVNWKKRIAALGVLSAALVVASLSTTRQMVAQTIRGVLVQDVDQPARAPFQVRLSLNTNILDQTVTIPAGKRLVVDYVTVNGDATSANGGIQPIVTLTSTVAGNASSTFYIAPVQSTSVPEQFLTSGPTKIYADSLVVGLGFSGFSPNNLAVGVAISGHLITP
jgi:hypothetical protein